MPKLVAKKMMDGIKDYVFLNGKNMYIHYKKQFLKIVQVACANGKGIERTPKMTPSSIPKSIKNKSQIHAWKSDANEKRLIHQQWIPKGNKKT